MGLEEERRLRRVGVGVFQGVGEIDMGAVGGQGGAAVDERAAHTQLAHRVGAGKELEAVEVPGQCRRLSGDGAGALFRLDAAQGRVR